MGNGWHEWPLMIFTVFGQCVAGGFIVLAVALLNGNLNREQQQRLVMSMFGLWVLMGIGFIASTLHLGSPMRAFNSLNRVGASSLSNEIASGALFFAVGGLGWLLAALKKLPTGLRNLWLIVTMVLGVVFVWMMVRVYTTIDTVPTWYSVWTPMSFFLTLFIGGPLLGFLLLRVASVDGWAMRHDDGFAVIHPARAADFNEVVREVPGLKVCVVACLRLPHGQLQRVHCGVQCVASRHAPRLFCGELRV